MTLEAGRRIGPYEIVAPLGAGGMGEVYRARDTKLGREVAIKVLPDALSADRDRLTRFEREARVLAALNHPNIATIYGVEEASGASALIMELVEGETLSEHLGQVSRLKSQTSGLPVAEAVAIARQIADALDAAHEKGIVHRDLKPANIKITPAGVVKVLDFGLAKAGESSGAGGASRSGTSDLSQSPTMASSRTHAGVILGTAAYMSPEQARGLTVDKRADTWAFGCVVYELLTGRVAFPGDTVSDVIVSVLDREPAWAALPAATPPTTVRLLRRCLEKDPRRRLRDIGDARLDLEESLTVGTPASSIGTSLGRREVVFRRLTDFVGMKETPSVSPDGKMIAFVALVAGKRQIFVSLIAGGAQLQLTRDPVHHEQPRWKPDSSALVYYTPAAKPGEDEALWEMSALGGWPRRLVSAAGGADVSHDGRRLVMFQTVGDASLLVTTDLDGSHVERVIALSRMSGYSSPRWSPDDHEIAYQRAPNAAIESALEVVPVTGGDPQVVVRREMMKGFCWLPDGAGFVYSSSRGSTVLYPPIFNFRTIDRRGHHDSPLTFGDTSFLEPDVDSAGRLIGVRIKSHSDIWKFPIDGSPADNVSKAIRVTRQTGHVRTPSGSPDGTEIVYRSDTGGHGNLWVGGTDQSYARQITFEADPSVRLGLPKWSPRGDQIVFVMTRNGQPQLSSVRPDGSGLRVVVSDAWGPGWSGDGRWLYYESHKEKAQRLEKIPIDGGESVIVRPDDCATLPNPTTDGSTLYYLEAPGSDAGGQWNRGAWSEIRRASPEDGPAETFARVPGERISGYPLIATFAVSPDGKWLATALQDGATTNLWAWWTADGTIRQLTDFGDRQTVMARSLSWSSESRHVFAAVDESERDIVSIDGLLPGK